MTHVVYFLIQCEPGEIWIRFLKNIFLSNMILIGKMTSIFASSMRQVGYRSMKKVQIRPQADILD